MSRQVKVSEAAKSDLREIRDYIAVSNVEAAKSVVRQIGAAFDPLGEMPMMGRERPELQAGLRSLIVGRYVVLYRLTEDAVEIVRILHGARHSNVVRWHPLTSSITPIVSTFCRRLNRLRSD